MNKTKGRTTGMSTVDSVVHSSRARDRACEEQQQAPLREVWQSRQSCSPTSPPPPPCSNTCCPRRRNIQAPAGSWPQRPHRGAHLSRIFSKSSIHRSWPSAGAFVSCTRVSGYSSTQPTQFVLCGSPRTQRFQLGGPNLTQQRHEALVKVARVKRPHHQPGFQL